MDSLLQLLVAAIVVESVNETLKVVYEKKKINANVILAIIVGILFAFSINVHLLSAVGINVVFPIADTIITGIIFSRGSTFVHELIKKITALNSQK